MALSVGLVSVAVGIGIPVFYETQIDNSVRVILLFFKSVPNKLGFLSFSAYNPYVCVVGKA